MLGNISKEKRDKLIAKIQELKNFVSDKDTEGKLSAYLNELETEISSKKFGLVYEEHREEIDEILENNTPVLSEKKEHLIPSGKVNFLIEGDNLASLKLLEKTHKGAIDVIYIDPPYNTGAKNWKYNNNYVDNTDTFRHSKWLSFMEKRLQIAKGLLSESGIIVITIDDYEIENITLLANEIFGEDNRLATIIIKNNPSGRSTVSGISISHEYALFYSRTQKAKLGRLPRNEKQQARYGEQDEKGFFEWVNFRKHGGYKENAPTMFYPIYIKKDCSSFRIPKLEWVESKKEYIPLEECNDDEIISLPFDENGRPRRWKWGLERAMSSTDEMMVKLDRFKNPAVYIKARMKDEGMLPLSVWEDKKYSSTEYGTNMLNDILENKLFDYPKSLYAVIDTLKVANVSKNSTILDFFAGSGTTGQAVMELNKEDGGNRQFILCTNNENNICEEVTFERMKRVIENNDYQEGLKYFKVDYVDTQDKVYYEYSSELLQHIKELVELENGIDFDNNKEISIALNDEQIEKMLLDSQKLLSLKKVYIGYDILLSAEQKDKFKKNGVELVVIPNYYYSEG